ncbi:DUF547 domain-containing protein [Desulfosarcina sp.]|uniref:DUF547 domain-containing protein n=1 Tax=Desulfosarcina sp. TaxID=2027861 RepID=UPI0029B550FB|nr:DUF547 domain-containing protein [Desulfosarcina sp.]MDX2455388.1 DUF547 domain-containing protein [Desulfosarcina sp.]MDX2492906.1 DUF547 domain-containing protein [Desulfosarcina sp.]
MIKNIIYLAVTSLIIIAFFPSVAAADFDHSIFDRALKTYVNDKGLVDYNGIAGDQAFKAYVQSLQFAKLDSMSRDEQLAFWINAYNAVTIDKVIKFKPKKSVRETLVPGLWTSTKFFTTREHTVAGNQLSQGDIEHEFLRKRFKDPRIHFAIICASSSCPPLPRFAYTGKNVQAKLEAETRTYINSQRGTRIDYAENTLFLSKLFDWFAGDFESKSGSVLQFINPYLEEETRSFVERNPMIAHIHYDWSLNAQAPLE